MTTEAIRLPAEVRSAAELNRLFEADRWPKPPGWHLSPRMVEAFLMGEPKLQVQPKFVGDRRLIQVAIATLASDRGLMLAGEPGTAKSWLSEHLTAAISGTSQLVIQGTAGTTEEQIKYAWNYALLIAEGPSPKALVHSPVMRAMERGQIVRVEELTRCAAEVQDAFISILSEKQIAIPELDQIITAKRGFAVIATANTRDRGVNEMSSALRRRFNFVMIPMLTAIEQEVQIVAQRSQEQLADLGALGTTAPSRDLIRLLTTVFQELRQGQTVDGKAKVKAPSTVLSTAELISVVSNAALMASFFGSGQPTVQDCVSGLVGAVAKENKDDLAVLKEYLETVVRNRSDGLWPAFYRAGNEVLGG